MPNPTKFNKPRAEARRLFSKLLVDLEACDLDERQDILEELSTVCTLEARDIENAIVDAEADRLRVVARIMHPSLSARERNPSL